MLNIQIAAAAPGQALSTGGPALATSPFPAAAPLAADPGRFAKVFGALLGASMSEAMPTVTVPPGTPAQQPPTLQGVDLQALPLAILPEDFRPSEDLQLPEDLKMPQDFKLPEAFLAMQGRPQDIDVAMVTTPPGQAEPAPTQADPVLAGAPSGLPMAMAQQPMQPLARKQGGEAPVQPGMRPDLPADPAGGRQILPEAMAATPPADTGDPADSANLKSSPGQPLPQLEVEGDAAPRPGMPVAELAPLRPVQGPSLVPTDTQLATGAPERMHEPLRTAAPQRETQAMQLPLRAQGWDGEFSQRIVWMANSRMQWAEISLNPPNLGNVEVRLSLNGNEAGAQFFSPNASVRDAIDASLPRLREMLAEAGIALGDAQVSTQSFADRRGAEGEAAASGPGAGGILADGTEQPALQAGRGLVDLFV